MHRNYIDSDGEGRRVTAQEASIKTETVKMKTITISAKHLRLSLFRQLQSEDLIDPESGQLNGEPWGRVNYYWGPCSPDGPSGHLHVVWQKADELRLACVFAAFSKRHQHQRLINKYPGDAVVHHRLLPLARNIEVLRCMRAVLEGGIKNKADIVNRKFSFLHCLCPLFDTHDVECRMLGDYLDLDKRVRELKVHDAVVIAQKIREHLDLNDDRPERLAGLEGEVKEFEKNWQESYAAVASTKQLFIGS